MGLVAVAETAELISAKQVTLSETDKEFVVQFAFATGDKELTNKLIDELACEGADKGAVLLKYSKVIGLVTIRYDTEQCSLCFSITIYTDTKLCKVQIIL